MKRDFDQVVKDTHGVAHVRVVWKYDDAGMPVTEINKANGQRQQVLSHYEPMTLRDYAMDALAGRWKGEEEMGNDDLYKRGKLHDKLCFTKGVVDLTGDESKTILDALNHQGASALVITRMKDLLETDPKPLEAAA